MSRTRTGYRAQSGIHVEHLWAWPYYRGSLNEILESLSGREDLGPSGRAILRQIAERLARKAKPSDVNTLLQQAGEGWLRQIVEDKLLEHGSRDINERLTEGAHLTSTLLELYRTSGIRDRMVVRLLLARDDLPQHLARELAEEAVIRGVKLRTERCDDGHYARVQARMSEQLAAELERLSGQLGVPISVETLTDPRVRVLAARLVRHGRNLASMPADAEGRRRRAETLFERSWQNACSTLAATLQAEHAKRAHAAAEAERERAEREREWEEWRKERERQWAEQCAEHEDEDGDDVTGPDGSHACTTEAELACSGRCRTACRDMYGPAQQETEPGPQRRDRSPHLGTTDSCTPDSGRGCTACEEHAIPAVGIADPQAWVETLVEHARNRRTTRAWCDLQGQTAWSDGLLLAEVLQRHEELPDQILAGIKRASAWHDGHLDPKVPLRPEVLLNRMGPEGLAALLRRLRTVRVQWPKNHRPPRYIRNPHSGVEWRAAARFLVKNCSEIEWLLDTAEDTDMLPEAARCALLLGPEVLAERSVPEMREMLCAAAGWDLDTLEGTLAAMRNARGIGPLEHAAVLLAGDLTEEERKIAMRLSENWAGSAADLIEVTKTLH